MSCKAPSHRQTKQPAPAPPSQVWLNFHQPSRARETSHAQDLLRLKSGDFQCIVKGQKEGESKGKETPSPHPHSEPEVCLGQAPGVTEEEHRGWRGCRVGERGPPAFSLPPFLPFPFTSFCLLLKV